MENHATPYFSCISLPILLLYTYPEFLISSGGYMRHQCHPSVTSVTANLSSMVAEISLYCEAEPLA
jgi:hypothetical protein